MSGNESLNISFPKWILKFGLGVLAFGIVGILVANSRSSVSQSKPIKIPEPPVVAVPRREVSTNTYQVPVEGSNSITATPRPDYEQPITVVYSSSQAVTQVTSPVVEVAPVTSSVAVPQKANVVTVQTLRKSPSSLEVPRPDLEWLTHLSRIEQQRRNMALNQLTSVITSFAQAMAESQLAELSEMDDPARSDRIQTLSAKIVELEKTWKEIAASYHSKVPPPLCQEIARTYSVVLSETSQMQLQILDQLRIGLRNPESAISSLQKMQGTSQSRIDKFGKQADIELAAICETLGIAKWFSISDDFGDSLGSIAKGWAP